MFILEPSYTYVLSKRGTKLILYDGNTYTPNDKEGLSKKSRNYKCSQYYRFKCKARLATCENSDLRVICALHSHSKIYCTEQEIADKLNYQWSNGLICLTVLIKLVCSVLK